MRRSGSIKLGQFLLTTGKWLHLGNSFHIGISLHWHDLMLWLWVILIESSLRANLIILHFVTLFAFILFFNQSYHLGNHVALSARRGNWGSTSSYDLTKIHANFKKEIKQNPQAVWLQVLHFEQFHDTSLIFIILFSRFYKIFTYFALHSPLNFYIKSLRLKAEPENQPRFIKWQATCPFWAFSSSP